MMKATPNLDTWFPDHESQPRERTLNQLLHDIGYQFPGGVTTFSGCANGACDNMARGGHLCVECLEKCLAELVGRDLAAEYIGQVRGLARLKARMHDAVG